HALATPRLPHHAEGLTLVDVEIDAVDGAYDPFIREEVGLQPFDLEKTFGHGASSDAFRYQRAVNSVNASIARRMSSASTSLWVTHRIAAGPIPWIFTLRAAQPATSSCVAVAERAASPRSTRITTMFVCTLA